MTISEVSDYLISLGFDIQPCSIPLNRNQELKRNLLLMVMSKSKRLFYFLRKISPIKYLPERHDKSIWFIYRDGGITYEIELKPESREIREGLSYSYDNFNMNHYFLTINEFTADITCDDEETIIEINELFSMFSGLHSLVRENKLSNILDI